MRARAEEGTDDDSVKEEEEVGRVGRGERKLAFCEPLSTRFEQECWSLLYGRVSSDRNRSLSDRSNGRDEIRGT